MCASRGFDCGEKFWGAGHSQTLQKSYLGHSGRLIETIRPSLPSSENDTLDSSYLQFFHEVLVPYFMEEQIREDRGRVFELVFRRFGLSFSSKPVRYAILGYSCAVKSLSTGDLINENHYHYISQFYTSMRDAISRQAYVELVYSCYIICLFSFISEKSFGEIRMHARAGLLSIGVLLKSECLTGEEFFLMRCMCKDIFCWMIWGFGRDPEGFVDGQREKELFELVELTAPLFRADSPNAGIQIPWIQKASYYLRTQMLLYRLLISFRYYAVIRGSCIDTEASRLDSFFHIIRTIMDDITEIISEHPHVRGLIDHSQLLGPVYSSQSSNNLEWSLWKPSLFAHTSVQFGQLLHDPHLTPGPGLGIRMAACQSIDLRQEKMTIFGMNSLSVFRSIMITGLLLTDQYPEGKIIMKIKPI